LLLKILKSSHLTFYKGGTFVFLLHLLFYVCMQFAPVNVDFLLHLLFYVSMQFAPVNVVSLLHLSFYVSMQFAPVNVVFQSRRKEIFATDININAACATLIMILVEDLRCSAIRMHGGSLIFTLNDDIIVIRIPCFKWGLILVQV
jgi:hypothetical protein